jgi:prolyl 4-hydroxylase
MSPAARRVARPGAQRARGLELFIVRGFLDLATCAALIERIDARRRPSQIADDIGRVLAQCPNPRAYPAK